MDTLAESVSTVLVDDVPSYIDALAPVVGDANSTVLADVPSPQPMILEFGALPAAEYSA
jgi:hypothetical protein